MKKSSAKVKADISNTKARPKGISARLEELERIMNKTVDSIGLLQIQIEGFNVRLENLRTIVLQIEKHLRLINWKPEWAPGYRKHNQKGLIKTKHFWEFWK